MSVNLNNFSLTAGYQFVAKHVSNFPDKVVESAYHILNGAATYAGKLMPKCRPTSVGEVVLQAKKYGSASFSTPDGDYLITITRDTKGRYIFQATGGMLEPVIFYEGKKSDSGAIWEVQVSNYLQHIVKHSHFVSYGDVAQRWKGDSFVDLKEKFAAEGFLRKIGDGVMLKFPEDEPIIFKAPYGNLKAEIALKYVYMHQKTPIEEEQSKPWDLLKRLFVGYLYFSGFALSPWVPQKAEIEEEKAQRMAADGYLDGHELREMALSPTLRQRVMDIAEIQADQGKTQLLSQLEHLRFASNGYTQSYEFEGKNYDESRSFSSDKEIHTRKVCTDSGFCDEYITEQSAEKLVLTQRTKIGVKKATFKRVEDNWVLVNEKRYEENRVLRLPDLSFATSFLPTQFITNAATVYLAALVTKYDPKIALISTLFPLLKYADALSSEKTARRTAPITILNPVPNLSVELGSTLNYNIYLPTFCQSTNPTQNVELSIIQSNGSPAPSWISMNMGAISLIKTKYFGGTINQLAVIGNHAYLATSSGFFVVDISNPSNPAIVGNYTTGGNVLSAYLQGNYAYISSNNDLYVINLSNPTNLTLVTQYSSGYFSLSNIYVQGNYLYNTNGVNLNIINIANPGNPISEIINGAPMLTKYDFSLDVFPPPSYIVSRNYIFFGHTQIPTRNSLNMFQIVNVTNPSNPVGIDTASAYFDGINYWGANATLVQNNNLFVAVANLLQIYDVSTISSPNLVNTVFMGSVMDSLTIEGNYLYASCLNGEVKIVNIQNILNAQQVSSFSSFDYPRNVAIKGNYVYIADNNAGLTIFNAAQRVLSGIPSLTDRGLLLLNITATDDSGNTAVNPIAIHVGDINVTPIPNQQVYVGNSTMFTFNANTFQFPNANFAYSATLVGGLPLPSCINFDANTHTFIFTPHSGDQNTYPIQVTANDGYGGVVSTTFNLVVPDRIPVLAQPLSNQTAYSGMPFNYVVASNSFTDGDNDQLTFTANLVGSNSLPGWLSFDPALLRFYGTPVGRSSYQIQLNANDEHGGIVSTTFTITVPPSAPIVVNSIGTQLASVNTPFSFEFNSNTFYDLDGDTMTYTTSPLPSFLSFNNATRTFSGTPQSLDDGTYTITLTATNPFGQSVSLTFDLTVLKASNNLPPIVNRQIPDYTITSLTPFNYTISSDTFIDPQNLNLTYTASLEGGNPLPNGIYFNTESLIVYGSVSLPQTLRITIKATDTSGVYNIDTFSLIVLDGTKFPPIVLNPLPDAIATVGAAFAMAVPPETFKDLNGDELTITVDQSGGLPLPKWLNWNPTTHSFSGTPGPFDTNTYATRVLEINVWAADSVGSVKTTFKITVQGESFWATFIKYGFSFGSVAVSALGVWKERALIWNYLKKEKYLRDSETAIVGNYYCHEIEDDNKLLAEIKAFIDDKPLPAQKMFLPDGFTNQGGKFQGVPTEISVGRYTIRVYDKDGYITEQFELIVKLNESDPDPEPKKKTHFMKENLGKIKARLPKDIQMRSLSNKKDDTKV